MVAASSLTNLTDIAKTFGAQFQMTPIGSKVVQGRLCSGYTIGAVTSTDTGHGTVHAASGPIYAQSGSKTSTTSA